MLRSGGSCDISSLDSAGSSFFFDMSKNVNYSRYLVALVIHAQKLG